MCNIHHNLAAFEVAYPHADSFEEYFVDCHRDVVIAGITFTAAQILKCCDPVAYKEQYLLYCEMYCMDESE